MFWLNFLKYVLLVALMTIFYAFELVYRVHFTQVVSYKNVTFSINHCWIEVNDASKKCSVMTKIAVKVNIVPSHVLHHTLLLVTTD